MHLSNLKAAVLLLAVAGSSAPALPTIAAANAAIGSAHPANALPAALRLMVYRALAKDAGPAYRINGNGCAALPKSALKACFDVRGAHFTGVAGPLSLHLVAFGRSPADHTNEARLIRINPVRPKIAATRVSYQHGGLTEWWRVLPIGFEQGFTIAKRPAGHGNLMLALSAASRHSGEGWDSVETNTPTGRRDMNPELPTATAGMTNGRRTNTLAWDKLRYGHLVVTDAQGKVVPASLTSKGDRILIAVNDVHAAYPLTVDPLVWITQKVTANDGRQSDGFGTSVAISGSTAFISTALNGVVYVFTNANGIWSQRQELTSDDGQPASKFGASLALDGHTALVGAPDETFNGNIWQGAVDVFTKSNGRWAQVAILKATNGQSRDFFGTSLALSGTTALIGAGQAINTPGPGAAYVFSDAGGAWVQKQKLTADDGADGDGFGQSVALSGTTAIIGAPGVTLPPPPGGMQGAAYVFHQSGGTWTQTQKLAVTGEYVNNQFGEATALAGAAAFVTGSEGVYVFDGSGGTWLEVQKLTSDQPPGDDDSFGNSLAISDTTAVIGDPAVVVGGGWGQGAVYVYTNSGTDWTLMRKFIEPGDPSHPVQFGFSVALNGSIALAGAPGAEVGGNPYQGAAYFYEQDDFGFTVVAPRTVQPGAEYVSQTIATNNSSAASPAVAVTMTVPAAATFVSATPTQGSCSEASGVVACDFGAISGNAGRATANVTLKATGTLGTTIKNTASLTNAKPVLNASAKSVIANNGPPVAKNGTLTTEENTPASGTLEASDPDGDQLTFIMVDPPSHGTVTLSDASTGAYLYTPDKNYSGADSFTFKANDGQADSNVATISITVEAAPPPPPPPSGGGGGGATDPLGLVLLGFIGLFSIIRRRYRSGDYIPEILRMKSFVLAFAIAGLCGSAWAGTATSTHSASQPVHSVQSIPPALRPALYGAMAKDAGPAYAINKDGCATLPKEKLSACFTDTGARFTGTGVAKPLALQLVAWGRWPAAGNRHRKLATIPVVAPTIEGDKASYARGDLTEWWRVMPMGFEQGITIANRPAGHGRLILALAASRPVASVSTRKNTGAIGWGKLRYGDLVVTDAKGKVVPVTLGDEGDRILIALNDSIARYPLRIDPTVWLAQEVTPNDVEADDGFGWSVAIEGTTAVVGAPFHNDTVGAAYVFTESNGIWTQSAGLEPSDGAEFDNFGQSVDLAGTTILIGAPDHNNFQGAAYVFTRSNATWTQSAELTASDGAEFDSFGQSVALAGTTAIIGAPGHNNSQGEAYVFSQSDSGWTETAALTASGGEDPGQFGLSVALAGTTAIIGAPGYDNSLGGAYVFSQSDSGWTQTAALTASDEEMGDLFGNSVALDGTAALVGAYCHPYRTNHHACGPGAAYVFGVSSGAWTQTAELTASDAESDDNFGVSVALSGNAAIIGAENHNAVAGAAYVFGEMDTTWTQTAELLAGDNKQDAFGRSVALAGSTALVGATAGRPGGRAFFEGKGDLGLNMDAPHTIQHDQQYVSRTIATNDASATSPAVTTTITVPATASFISASASQGSCSKASDVVTCGFGPIGGNGGTATASLKLKATGVHGTTFENVAGIANATPPLTASFATVIVNTPPAAQDGTLTADENTAANGTLKATDVDDDPLSFSIVTNPSHGSVTLDDASTGAYSYTPSKDYSGSDTLTFNASDGQAESNVATISITVKAAPPPPPPPSGGGGGGGGATGPLGLVLLGFIGLFAFIRRRHRPGDYIPEILRIKSFVLAFAIAGLCGSTWASTATSTHSAAQPVHSAKTILPALRPALYGAMAKDAGPAYRITADGCAALLKPALKACFDRRGAHFTGDAAPLSLQLVAFGRSPAHHTDEARLTRVNPVRPKIVANRVNYAHGSLTEWWRVLPMGFEQGFTVSKRPAGHGNLTLALAPGRLDTRTLPISHSRKSANPAKHMLAWGKLRYGDLVVTDAKGQVIPAMLTTKGNRILIFVNDVSAAYPLTVDPLVWIEQKVFVIDDTAPDLFGASVAVDGATAIIGAPGVFINENSPHGVAYVFGKTDGTWIRTATLAPNDGTDLDEFGASVALDGVMAVVGAPDAPHPGSGGGLGAAYVFAESGGVWTQSAKLVADINTGLTRFGYGVAISGATILVGAPNSDEGAKTWQGAAYVFDESNDNWTKTAKLTADDGVALDEFGFSVALSGATAIIGAPYAAANGNSAQGKAYVFNKSDDLWTQAAELSANDGTAFDEFGFAVDIDDSNTIIGAPQDAINGNSHQGSAYIFTRSGNDWMQTVKLLASDGGEDDWFGREVALSGRSAVIGAPGSFTQGEGYIFTESGGSWTQAVTFNEFGGAVAISDTTALFGNSSTLDQRGAAYFYGESNLGLSVSVPETVNQGQNYVSQGIATNNATVASPAVAVTIAVPTAASFVGASASQGNCSEDSDVVTCDFGAIDGNSGTATANVTFKATGDVGATIENRAGVAMATPALTASAPTVIKKANSLPVAKDGTLTTEENTPANGTLEASDPDGDPLTFIIVDQPKYGTVSQEAQGSDTYLYTPDRNYSGSDSFTFKTNDGQADSNVATISITVKAAPPPPPPPSGGGGGGGATGPLGLSLLALAGGFALWRRRKSVS